jgi:RNase P/RNase MRP subunit p29
MHLNLVEKQQMNDRLNNLLRAIAAPTLITIGFIASQTVLAQTPPPPVGVRGTITEATDDAIKVHTNRGEDLTIKLTKDTQVRAVTLAKITDIKPGSYIGTAAIPQPDGSQKALEVHVFPPAMAGTGDGHRAWDLSPNSTMTNGTVGDLVASNGRTLTLKYKGGEKKIIIPEDVPIVNLELGDKSLLVVGAKVVLFGKKEADSSLTAWFISAGKGGVTPPM